MEKCGRARQATDGGKTHALCIWLPKATDIHFGFAVMIAFLQQQWYANVPPYYVYNYTASLVVTKTSGLILPLEIISFCCGNYTKHTNTLCGKNVGFLNLK